MGKGARLRARPNRRAKTEAEIRELQHRYKVLADARAKVKTKLEQKQKELKEL